MIRFIRDPQPPFNSTYKIGMVRELGTTLNAQFIASGDAVDFVELGTIYPPAMQRAEPGETHSNPVRALTAAQAAALGAAPLSQAGSTVAVLNAGKTALRDPAGGADIALGGGGGGGSPGGSTTQLQINNAGAFGGTATLTHDFASASLVKTMDGAGGGGTLWKTASTLNAASPGYSQQWREGQFFTPFTYTDFVMNIGYNYTGSARVDTAFPAQFLQLEAAYQLNNSALASMKVTEMHWNHVSVDGRARRPFAFIGAWDGEFISTAISGSTVQITDLAANTRVNGLYLDGETVLVGAITSVATTLVLAKARAVANGQLVTVQAEGSNTSETMLVTAGGGTVNLTVTRGQSNTVASAHANGAAVFLPAATLAIYSAAQIASDAASPFVISNAASTINWLVINSAGSALNTAIGISAPVQNLCIITNTAANGTAALQLKANNGAKTAALTMGFGGSFAISINGQGGTMIFDCAAPGFNFRSEAFTTILNANASNQIGVGHSAQSAMLHIKAGTATAGTAPFKLTSGVSLTTAENGAFEYNGTNLFFTRAGAVREGVITQSVVTTEAGLVMDTSVTVNIGGVAYKLMARAI